MRELWNASFGTSNGYNDGTPESLKLWWGCFIVGNILGNLSLRLSTVGDEATMASAVLSALSNGVLICCAIVLMQIMRDVTEVQNGQFHTAVAFA